MCSIQVIWREFVWWTQSAVRGGTISALQGVSYTLTWDNTCIKIRKEILNKLVKQQRLMVGTTKRHPWLKLTPVLKLWFMEHEFFSSLLERQRDISSVKITGFHQSFVAENYKFLEGIHACELLQHNVEEGHHETWSKEGYWRQHFETFSKDI